MRFRIDPDVPVMTLMEICGSHTMAIARHGIRQCLPPQVKLISGPGCPVCVTPGGAIDAALALSMRPDVIICSYGDMLRVPGSAQDTLLKRRGKGGDVRICLSVSDAIRIAQDIRISRSCFSASASRPQRQARRQPSWRQRSSGWITFPCSAC